MRYVTHRTDHLLELVRALRRYEGETDDRDFIEALRRTAENLERRRERPSGALHRPVDLVA